MRIGKNIRNNLIIYTILFIMGGVVRLIEGRQLSLQGISSGFYCAMVFVWMWHCSRGFIQKRVIRMIVSIGLFMTFWLLVRVIKYNFMFWWPNINRILWYSYYIPIIMIPLLIFLVMLYIDIEEGKRIDSVWYVLFIAAAVIIILILTNDLHYLAFRPKVFSENWDLGEYIYGPAYYSAVGMIILLIIFALAAVLRKYRKSSVRRRLWLPLMVVGAGFLYDACYALLPGFERGCPWRLPECLCFIMILFVESMAICGFFPLNNDYKELMDESSFGMGIMDRNSRVVYSSRNCPVVDTKDVKASLSSSVVLPDKKTVLSARKVKGGTGFWLRDKSRILKLKEELVSIGDVIKEENSMLLGENRIAEAEKRLEHKNRLYDDLNEIIRPELDILNEILMAENENEEQFEQRIKYACVIGAFIKRFANIMIIADERTEISFTELALSVREAIEYIKLYGVPSHADINGEGSIPADHAMYILSLLEAVTEVHLNSARALLVSLEKKGETAFLKTETAGASKRLDTAWLKKKSGLTDQSIEVIYDENEKTDVMTFSIGKGGEH